MRMIISTKLTKLVKIKQTIRHIVIVVVNEYQDT